MRCPNCGHDYEGEFCANCGKPQARTGSRILAVLIAIFLVLPLALVGACSVFVGGTGLLQGRQGGDMVVVGLLVAAFAIPAFLGLGYLVIRLWKG